MNYNMKKVNLYAKAKREGARDVNEDCATVYTIAFLERCTYNQYIEPLLLVIFA